MKTYSKLIGTLVGAGVGMLGAFGIDTEWMTPEVQGALITMLSIAGTYFAPANK